MTTKQEIRKLTGERKRIVKRMGQIDIRIGALQGRLEVKKKINPRGKASLESFHNRMRKEASND